MFLFLWYTSTTRSAHALLIRRTMCGQQNETKPWPYETPGEREDWDGKWNPNKSEYCELLSSAGSKGLQPSLAPGQRTRGLGIMPNIPGAGRDSFCSTSSSQVPLPLLPSASYCDFTSCSSSHAQTQVNVLELEYFSPRFNLVHLNFCLLRWLPSGSAHSDGVACTAFKALQKRDEMLLLPYFAEWGATVEVGEISPITLKKLAIKKACQSLVRTEGDFGFNSPQISVDSAQVSSDFFDSLQTRKKCWFCWLSQL